MASSKKEPAGIKLLNAPDEDIGQDNPKQRAAQVMQIDLAMETVREMQKAVKAGKGIQLSFGRTPVLRFGNTSKVLRVTPTAFRKELYQSSEEGGLDLQFAGLFSHSIALEKVLETTAGADAALEKLKANLAGFEKDKKENEATFIDKDQSQKILSNNTKKGPKAFTHRKNLSVQRAPSSSRPNSPHPPNSSSTPNAYLQPPKSVPSTEMDSLDAKEKAQRIAIIHYLAMGPAPRDEISEHCNVADDVFELEPHLAKLADKEGSGWKLRDRPFNELEPYKWNYPSEEERKAAVGNAIKAFDRQRVPRDDPRWQRLLPEKDRGQGICLSKFNFSTGFHGAPRPETHNANSAYQASKSNHRALLANAGGGDIRGSRSPEPGNAPKASDRVAQEKRLFSKKPVRRTEPAIAKKESQLPANEKEVKEVTRTKSSGKDSKNAKVKSAEYVVDSDSEDVPLAESHSRKETATPNKKPKKAKPNPADFSADQFDEEADDIDELLALPPSRRISDAAGTANGIARRTSDARSPHVEPRGTKRRSTGDSEQLNKKARSEEKEPAGAQKEGANGPVAQTTPSKEQAPATTAEKKQVTTATGSKTQAALKQGAADSTPSKKRRLEDEHDGQASSPPNATSRPQKKSKTSPTSSSPLTNNSELSMTSVTSPSLAAVSKRNSGGGEGAQQDIKPQANNLSSSPSVPEESMVLKSLKAKETIAWQRYYNLRFELDQQELSSIDDEQMDEVWKRFDAADALTKRVKAMADAEGAAHDAVQTLKFTKEEADYLEEKLEKAYDKCVALHKHYTEAVAAGAQETEQERNMRDELERLDREVSDLKKFVAAAKAKRH